MATNTKQDELVTVARFDNDLDASLAQQCLMGAGIDAFLSDRSTVATAWHLTGALGGIKLLVAARDFEEASEVLKKARDGELEVEEDWTDDEAGTEGDADEDDAAEPPRSSRVLVVDRSLKSMVLSLLFMPLSFYTAWLLLDVTISAGELGVAHRRRAIGVAVVTVIQVGVGLFLLRSIARDAMSP